MMQLYLTLAVTVCVLSCWDHVRATSNPTTSWTDGQEADLNRNMASDWETQDSHQISEGASYKNRHPVIGILSQETESDRSRSYIFEAYVKFIEESGALVVPVRIDEPEKYYTSLFKKINGVVFPGGGVSLLTSGYAKAAKHFFTLAKQANDRGDVFPILGICLGLEEMTTLVTIDNKLVSCQGVDFSVPLELTSEAKKSRMFRDIPEDLYQALSRWNLTYNNHEYCMSTKVFKKNKLLSDFYNVLSTNVAKDGVEFVSSMEAFKYPFYGLQWHPAKNIYLWSDARVNHSAMAVRVAQYIGNFFVDQARQSKHCFDDLDDLGQSVISNYQPVFLGAPSFHSLYYFDIHSDASDDFFFWDWPKFTSLTDIGLSQFLNFLLFILMLIVLIGVLSSLTKQRLVMSRQTKHLGDTKIDCKPLIINEAD